MSMLGLRFWMLWLRLPRIGGLARLALKPGLAEKWDGTWRNSELELCHMFKGHLNAINRDAFNNYLSYLGKAGDTGRKPAPAWLQWTLASAVAVESMAWAYALFPEMSLAPSGGITVLSLGVAALLGLTLLYFMCQAGGQAYRNHLIKDCRRHHALGEGQAFPGKLAEIQASQAQAGDAADPPYIQCLRRVGNETGVQSMLVAAILLLVVAGYAALVHMKRQAGLDTEGIGAGLGADVVLGILFLVTQTIAASVAYRHQLGAKQGSIAYAGTRGHATYEEYVAQHDGLVMHWAEQSLKQLQSAIQAGGGEGSGGTHHSFHEFLFLTRQDEIKYDLRNIPHREAKRPTATRIESLLVRIAELKHENKRAEAIALIQDLPEPEKAEVKERLQALAATHDDEISRRAAERKELEKLL